MPGGPIWILEAVLFSLGCVTSAHLLSDYKSFFFFFFEWDPEQEKSLQQVHIVVQKTLQLGA